MTESFEKHQIRKARDYLFEIQFLNKSAKKVTLESRETCFDNAVTHARNCGAVQIISCVQKYQF